MIQRAALSLFGGRVQRVSPSPRCHGGVVYGSPVGVCMLYGCVCVCACVCVHGEKKSAVPYSGCQDEISLH